MMYNNDEETEIFRMRTAGKPFEKDFPAFFLFK